MNVDVTLDATDLHPLEIMGADEHGWRVYKFGADANHFVTVRGTARQFADAAECFRRLSMRLARREAEQQMQRLADDTVTFTVGAVA